MIIDSTVYQYSKNPYIRTLNFESQAAVGSYLMIMISNIRLYGFFIYETLDPDDNLHSIERSQISRQEHI